MNKIIFCGMNITNVVQDALKRIECEITNDMDEKEIKAYQTGTNNAISILDRVLKETETDYVIHMEEHFSDKNQSANYTYEELKNIHCKK